MERTCAQDVCMHAEEGRARASAQHDGTNLTHWTHIGARCIRLALWHAPDLLWHLTLNMASSVATRLGTWGVKLDEQRFHHAVNTLAHASSSVECALLHWLGTCVPKL